MSERELSNGEERRKEDVHGVEESETVSSGVEAKSGFEYRFLAAQPGEVEEVGRLLEGYRNYLLVIANSVVNQDLQAKLGGSDLVQETLLEAHRIFDRFDGTSPDDLRRWLTRILENKVGNSWKRYFQTGRRDVNKEINRKDSQFQAQWNQLEAPSGNSPSRSLRIEEEQKQVRAAIQLLPEDLQTVIRLRIDEGLSFDEIGRKMERTEEAVRKLLARALVKLKRDFEKHDG
ncbi:MAG: sigma-70 family RNA polymerase sigma factor [Planctomycetes bacterium]|nr:sigma-70 family RNA polymerase sigma factor [Planctomycetota bacterium]